MQTAGQGGDDIAEHLQTPGTTLRTTPLQRESVNEYNAESLFENRRYAIPGMGIYYLWLQIRVASYMHAYKRVSIR